MVGAKLKKNDKFLVRMVWQFLLLLIVTVAIGSYTYYNALRNNRSDLIRDMREDLSEALKLLDIRLEEMRNTAVHFQRDENVIELLDSNHPFEKETLSALRRLIQVVSIRNSTNDIVADILLCFDLPRLIVDSDSSTSRTDLYFIRYTFDEGIETPFFFEDDSLNSWISSVADEEERQARYTMYSVPLIAAESGDFKGNAIFLISLEKVSDLFSSFVARDMPLVITEANDNLPIFWTGTTDQFSKLSGAADSSANRIWARSSYLPISEVSYQSKLKLDAFVPTELVYARSLYIRRIFIITTIAELILGLLLVAHFLYVNYRPIKRILKKIQTSSSYEMTTSASAYEYIEGSIGKIIQDNYVLQNELQKQDALLKTSILDRLLRGSLTDLTNIAMARREFDSRVNHFAVVLLKINPLSYEKRAGDIRDVQALRLIANRLLEDTVPHDRIIHNTEQDLISVLIGLRGNPSMRAKQEIEEYYLSVKSTLDYQYRIKVSVGIGRVREEFADVNRSFVEAQRALTYIFSAEGNESVWYREPLSFADTLYYPLATEERLIAALRIGNRQDSDRISDAIFEENFLDKTLSPKQARILFEELKGTIARAIGEIGFDESQVLAIDETLSEADATRYAEGKFAIFKAAFADICDIAVLHQEKQNDYAVNLIEDYIKRNFSNRDFCLASVADKFSYNENYFSQYFKRHVGKTFSSYVEKIRLDYTRKLLSESTDTVDEVAIKAGFLSTSTFYRKFRKVYGLSPSSFRHVSVRSDFKSG